MKKLSWIDLRNLNEYSNEITEEALHIGASALVISSLEQARRLPPNIPKVLVVDGPWLNRNCLSRWTSSCSRTARKTGRPARVPGSGCLH